MLGLFHQTVEQTPALLAGLGLNMAEGIASNNVGGKYVYPWLVRSL